MTKRSGDSARSAGPVDQQIGARIRARRLQIGMSQETLASKLGITFQQVQKYEKGVNRVAAPTLLNLADALDAPVLSLLPGIKQESGQSFIDQPGFREFLPLLLDLNEDGRNVLASLAKTLAEDAKFRSRAGARK